MNILVIGGNRFFGKKLAAKLLGTGHEVTLLNRGSLDDGLGNQVQRLTCDRTNEEALRNAVKNKSWDIVYDQVCFNADEAKSAREIFRDNTGHYIFTSSQSVYDAGSDIKEDVFNPLTYQFTEIADRFKSYAEAKRQCETVFFQSGMPLTALRIPIVVGHDDYTKRFSFHIERVKKSEPIFFPDIAAKMSMISSDDAASVLEFLGAGPAVGPVNAASAEPIVLANFLKTISDVTGSKAVMASEADDKNHSPYGIESNWYMNVQKLESLGYFARPIESWLSAEIKVVLAKLV